jgi:hypothetical protein
MLTNLFNDQIQKRRVIPVQALHLDPFKVILAGHDLFRSSRPLARPSGLLEIAEPGMSIRSRLIFALHASLGVAAVTGTILALFAWTGASL